MFTDFTTAETLAHQRATELERRIRMEHRRAQREPAPRRVGGDLRSPVGRVLGTLHLTRQHPAAAR